MQGSGNQGPRRLSFLPLNQTSSLPWGVGSGDKQSRTVPVAPVFLKNEHACPPEVSLFTSYMCEKVALTFHVLDSLGNTKLHNTL